MTNANITLKTIENNITEIQKEAFKHKEFCNALKILTLNDAEIDAYESLVEYVEIQSNTLNEQITLLTGQFNTFKFNDFKDD